MTSGRNVRLGNNNFGEGVITNMSEPTWKRGDHVEADFADGPVVAHYVSGPHQQGEEVKHTIQAPDGSHADLGYREPKDRDDKGSGRTFWKV